MAVILKPSCKKRLITDFRLVRKEPLDLIDASPDDSDMLTWYFIIKGPPDSVYEGGWYLGKIMHNEDYPFKPPNFMMLTPSGRFIPNEKICMSNTSYHSDEWSSTWNINTILLGFLSIMMDEKEHGISHIKHDMSVRKKHAEESVEYNKKHYPEIIKKFTRFFDDKGNPK
jgi:ubiquitin-conjugating enzyme E2 J2